MFTILVVDVGPGGLGLLLAAPAAGAVLGSLVISTRPTASRPGRGVLIAVALAISLALIIGLAGANTAVRDTLDPAADPHDTVEIPAATARPEPETPPELGVAG